MPDDTVFDIGRLALPPRVHGELLTGKDPYSTDLAVVILWAERVGLTCPHCGQPVPQDPGCPAYLDTGYSGGLLIDTDQQHDCGLWMPVTWGSASPDQHAAGLIVAQLVTARATQLAQARANA